jgi:hypothetical protein
MTKRNGVFLRSGHADIDGLGEQQTTDVGTTEPNDGKGLQFKCMAKISAYLIHDLCAPKI